GYLGLAAPLGLGLALSDERPRPWRILLGAAGVLCVVGVLLSLSRAGIVALAVGQAALMVLLLRRRTGTRRRVAILFGCLAVGAVAVAVVASDRLVAQLSASNVAADLQGNVKIQMWKDTLPLAGDFWRA